MIPPRFRRAIACAALAVAFPVSSLEAQAAPAPQFYCIQNVAIERGDDGRTATLVLRNGRIESVLDASAPAPVGARVIDGSGLIALPAFVDAYTRNGVQTPLPVKDRDLPVSVRSDVRIDMRRANRKGVQPAFRAIDALAIETKQSEAWREAGFGAALVSPGSQLLSGSSVLATTREAAMRDIVMVPAVFAHAAFQASASDGRGYPSTLMGYTAQLRQFFLDVRWHGEMTSRYEQGRPGGRPAYDKDLDAGVKILAKEQLLLCHADSYRDMERWMRLADEFDLEIAITGGREAWKVADQLEARGIPVFLTLDWGDEVKDPDAKKKKKKKKDEEAKPEEDSEEGEKKEKAERNWKYEEPVAVRREKRRLWEERRDCALRLEEAGVRYAFGTDGKKPGELLEKVRTLVEAGLSEDAALRALTESAAEMVGVPNRLGAIAPGFDASLTLWNGDPLANEKAKPVWTFVDGFPTEYEREELVEAAASGEGPAEGVDVTGTWTVDIETDDERPPSKLKIEMSEEGDVTGEMIMQNPMDGSEMTAEVTGSVSGSDMTITGTLTIGEFSIDFELSGTLDGDDMEGQASFKTPWSEEAESEAFEASREPDAAAQGTSKQ